MSQLPDKLSALIRVALADLRKVEADPLFTVDMGEWFTPDDDGFCSVCLAGAVMAKTLNAPLTEELCPSAFIPGITADKLAALNHARTGFVRGALRLMGLSEGSEWPDESAPDYDRDRLAFHAYMEDLANRLEEKGL